MKQFNVIIQILSLTRFACKRVMLTLCFSPSGISKGIWSHQLRHYFYVSDESEVPRQNRLDKKTSCPVFIYFLISA